MKYDLRVTKDEVKRKNRLRLLVDTPRRAKAEDTPPVEPLVWWGSFLPEISMNYV
jgi:hypothetical protein